MTTSRRLPVPISRSQLRKLLRRFKIVTEEIGDLAIHEHQLWPHAASERVVGPKAIRERHLSREVREQIHDGHYLRVAVPAQTWDGPLTLGEVLDAARWPTADRFPADGYCNIYLDLPVTEPRETTFEMHLAGQVWRSGTSWAAGQIADVIALAPTSDSDSWELHADGLQIGDGELVLHLVDRASQEVTTSLHGRITDADTGLPIEGATITLNGETTTSTSEGTFVFSDAEPGSHTLTVELDGYQDHTQDVTLPEGETTTVDVALDPVSVSGTVTDDTTGSPIEGAAVTLNGHDDTTDADGAYALTHVADGSYTLTVTADDYDDHTEPVTVDRTSQTIDVALEPTLLTSSIVLVAGSTDSGATGSTVAYRPADDLWSSFSSLPVDKIGAGGAVLGEHLYVFGGQTSGGVILTSHHRYDQDTDSWSSRTALPSARVAPAVAVLDGYMYSCGGSSSSSSTDGTDSVWRYDPDTDSWETRTPLSFARRGAAAVAYDGKIYLLGGFLDDGNVSRSVQVYDPAADSWTFVENMPLRREGHGAEVIDGKIYVVGGRDGNEVGDNVWGQVDRYDPATDTWTADVATLPTPRTFGVSGVIQGWLYYIGGLDAAKASEATRRDEVERYDPAAGTWETATAAPEPRNSMARGAPVTS